MTNRKKIGGPKTSQGKAKVATNAIKHNLSTTRLTSQVEINNVEQYAKELIQHYATNDPLEILQLQRIALYREKLSKVYEAERAAAQLAKQSLENDPQRILETMTHLNKTSRAMIAEYLDRGRWVLPCSLSVRQLENICKEIDCLDGNLSSEDDMVLLLPHLSDFLKEYKISSTGNKSTLDQKLAAVSKRLDEVFTLGDKYREGLRPLLEEVIELKYLKDELSENSDPKFEEYVNRTQAKYRKLQKGAASQDSSNSSATIATPFPPMVEIEKLLNKLNYLLVSYRKACGCLEQYHEAKALYLKTLDLPHENSELLMRYQTNWERRLSAAIGEFLALQRRNAKPF